MIILFPCLLRWTVVHPAQERMLPNSIDYTVCHCHSFCVLYLKFVFFPNRTSDNYAKSQEESPVEEGEQQLRGREPPSSIICFRQPGSRGGSRRSDGTFKGGQDPESSEAAAATIEAATATTTSSTTSAAITPPRPSPTLRPAPHPHSFLLWTESNNSLDKEQAARSGEWTTVSYPAGWRWWQLWLFWLKDRISLAHLHVLFHPNLPPFFLCP